MRRVFLALSIGLLLAFIYFAVVNMNNSINLSYLYSVADSQTYKTLSLGVYTLISLFSGVFVGAGIVYMFLCVNV